MAHRVGRGRRPWRKQKKTRANVRL
jgi:hypothetical protein